MKYIYVVTLLAVLFATPAVAQELTQTVRGTIIDTDSKIPLPGVQVVIADSDPIKGTATNYDGEFRLDDVPIGRIALRISHIGFESIVIPNVIVNSGKEVYLDVSMRESIVAMDELVVTPDTPKGEAMNDMALISSRSISPEETKRYPGGFDDPARILSNFAGVTNSQTGVADIIIRGNSPKYVQWRLEGVPITNPNHFADHNGSGILNTLNNNLLATSDFYTGAFSPEYGNVLSGVYDVKFRRGNNEKFESVFGFGLMGTDLTVEGPFKKGYNGSYLFNYRYSTITLVSQVGLIPDIGGIPKFQDASFKLSLPTKGAGTFSIFGLSGMGSFEFEDVTMDFWETPGERGMNADITEDFKKRSHLLNTGINHTLTLNNNSFISTTLAYSNEGINDKIFELPTIEAENDNRNGRELNYSSDILKSTYRASISYNNKLNARNNLKVGTRYALFDYKNHQSNLQHDSGNRFTLADFHENLNTITNYIGWEHRVNENLTIVSGLHNMNVLLNNKSTLEPRIAMNWDISSAGSIHAGYGNHSTMEGVHHYFSKVEQDDGSIIEPNGDLDLLKAHHYVVGYETRFGKNLRAKVEFYYQDLYNLPVENDETSNFATINEGVEFRNVDLVNEGTGKNYGVEITLERFFANNYYFMLNSSLYTSKYTALDGVERNTMYNGDYLVNILAGKEFDNLGSKQNQTLSLNAKAFFGGGKKIIPLLRDTQGNLAVDTDNNRYFDYSKAYESSLDDIFTLTLSASYKWNKLATTHELYLNVDNVTNSQSRLNEYYDENEPDSIGYMVQSFFFPNLMYKVYF